MSKNVGHKIKKNMSKNVGKKIKKNTNLLFKVVFFLKKPG